mgnify:CR=1 FL=1
MKKFLSILLLATLAMTASAQYQVTNSNFEQWESVSGGEEPLHWSSFLTASGSYASTVKAEQLVKSTDVRSGATGIYCAKITARSILGNIAQGNMTTGQINGGSMSASDASGNYNWTNTSNSDFNMPFTGRPDALRVWIKYYGKSSSNPYGKISAFLHGDGYYQDPNTANTGQLSEKIAEARKSDFKSTDGWVQMTVPFVYSSNSRPSYALVSFATNVTPGGGDASDYMFIDDMEMLYYSELASATYNGVDINFSNGAASVNDVYNVKLVKFTSNGVAATIEQSFNEETYLLSVTVKGDNFSEDLTNFHTYTIQFTGMASGEDDESSVTTVPETYTPQSIKTGSFYLMNMATHTFLGNNNALSGTPHKWNVSGSYKFTDDSSKALQLARNSSNSSFVATNFKVYSNASTSNATTFTSASQEDGSVKLYSYIKYYDGILSFGSKSANIYYAANSGNALTCEIEGSTTTYSNWKLVSVEQYAFWQNYE